MLKDREVGSVKRIFSIERAWLSLLAIVLLIVFSLGVSADIDAVQKKGDGKQLFPAETTRYDFCGARPWQRNGFCGNGQTGKGYTVCATYLKHLNQSLPKLSVCDIPVPPKFKKPDWEEMDVTSNLQLAYEAEIMRFSWLPWYKKPGFEAWKKEMLEEIAARKILPRMRKARIRPTSKGEVTILGYTRDSAGCDKGMRGIFPEEGDMNNLWTGSGDVYFILTAQGSLLNIHSWFGGEMSGTAYELLLHAGKPYFVIAPGPGDAFYSSTTHPRGRAIIALDNFLTMSNGSPDYLYTKQLCHFTTDINLIHIQGDKP